MKRIFTIFALACGVMNLGFAQIVSYEYNPAQVLNATYAGESLLIDFDGDLTSDLVIYGSKNDTAIQTFPVTITGFAIGTFGATEIAGTVRQIGMETILEADTLLLNDVVDGSLAYVNSSTPSVFPGVGLGADAGGMTTIGKFSGKGTKYVGVKFEIGGFVHYGWIRLTINANSTVCTIDSYGYETTANTPINAGKMADGGFASVEELLVEGKVFLKDQELQLLNLQGATANIYNMLGELQQVVRVNANSKSILVDHLPSGVYLVQCNRGSEIKTFKFFKS